MSKDGEIDQSLKYIEKASSKVLNKLYCQYEQKRLEKANKFITDILISKLSGLLAGLDAIDSVEKKDKHLRRDVENLVSSITPYLPYLGFLSGGITVGKHI